MSLYEFMYEFMYKQKDNILVTRSISVIRIKFIPFYVQKSDFKNE